MKTKTYLEKITPAIVSLRGTSVILDSDLARIYGTSTKALNQAVKRNRRRFPSDFVFRLSRDELIRNRSQFVTGSRKHRDPRFRPLAFTEQGAIMAANALNSMTAIRMSVFVVRAFVRMRAILSSEKGLAEELEKLEKKLTGRLNAHEIAIVDILRRLIKLLEPQPVLDSPEKPKGPIGFQP